MTTASVPQRSAAPFGQEWRACAVIARLALSKRASLGSNWLSWSLLVLALIFTAAMGFGTGKWRMAIGFGAGIPLSLLAWLWWFYLIEAVRNQNHPAAYKLVPDMGRRSRLVLLAAWLFLSTATGLVLSLALGEPMLMCVAAALTLAVSGALIRWQFTVVFVLMCLMPYLSERLGIAPGALGVEPGFYGLAVLACAALLVCGLIISSALGRAAPSSVGQFDMNQFPLYGRFLGADCLRGDRVRLLMHGLGPQAHSKTQAVMVAAGLLGAAVVALFADVPLAVGRIFFLALAVALQFAVADRLAATMYARQREQALLRLVVRSPDAKQFNAVLSGAIVRQFLAWWGGTTAIALAFAWLTGVPVSELASLFAVFCLTLMAGGTLLRNYARRPHHGFAVKAAVVTLFTLTNVMLMVASTGKGPALAWLALAAAASAAAVAFMAFRARAMRRAPAAFPAGRSA